jgi:hypothetical protein
MYLGWGRQVLYLLNPEPKLTVNISMTIFADEVLLHDSQAKCIRGFGLMRLGNRTEQNSSQPETLLTFASRDYHLRRDQICDQQNSLDLNSVLYNIW